MWNAAIVRRPKLGRSSARGISEASDNNIGWWLHTRAQEPAGLDLAIRWGCTSRISTTRVLNTSEAIHEVNDKLAFRKKMDESGGLTEELFYEDKILEAELFLAEGGILVVRPEKHSQGRNLWVVTNEEELERAVSACTRLGMTWYGSKKVDKVAEYRITFVQGRVAWVAKKTPGNPNDVAWNVARGGRFDNVQWGEWPLRAVRVAREAFLLTSLDFGGVDVMVDNEGKVHVLEINSAPSLTSPYRINCMAKCFDYICTQENKNRIPVIEGRGDWKKFIHPALSDRAIVG